MNGVRFESIARLLTERKLSRRRAVQQGAAGLAAAGLVAAGVKTAAAQESTPAPAGESDKKIEYLFVQSFHGGSIAPRDGGDGAYTVTFQHGLGQTLYFSDRPDRIVGATPTTRFIEGFLWGPDNPPNAALVITNDDGETDIAVVELTNPVYDETTATATYDVQVLENFDHVGMQLEQTASDLESISTPFGAAHLFIDNCPDQDMWCVHTNSQGVLVYTRNDPPIGVHGTCYDSGQCKPCNEDVLLQECNGVHGYYCNPTTPCKIGWWW